MLEGHGRVGGSGQEGRRKIGMLTVRDGINNNTLENMNRWLEGASNTPRNMAMRPLWPPQLPTPSLTNIGLPCANKVTYGPHTGASPFIWVEDYDSVVVFLSGHCHHHTPAHHPNVHLLDFVTPLQPCHPCINLTFSSMECNGEVHFAGLAPHWCQTAINIAQLAFWHSTCGLSPLILKQPRLSIVRVSTTPIAPCMTLSPVSMPCMHSTTMGIFSAQ